MPPTEQDIAKLEDRLKAAHGQADSLLVKLQAIKSVTDQLPGPEFLDELETRLDSISRKCAAIQGPAPASADGGAPTADDLTLLAARLGEIIGGLQQFAKAAEQLAEEVDAEGSRH
ncbi:MAG TPA: hypothetical protein VMV69_12060 [Pirellulales bacterium]|nr:hypothetical protein [Pirellulales bacterium]